MSAGCAQADAARETLDLLDAERARIGRRLHDRAVQDLTAVHLRLGILGLDPEVPGDAVAEIEADLTASLSELRAVMSSLEPSPTAPTDARNALAEGIHEAAPEVEVRVEGDAHLTCTGCARLFREIGRAVRGRDRTPLLLAASGDRITVTGSGPLDEVTATALVARARLLGLRAWAASRAGDTVQMIDACGAPVVVTPPTIEDVLDSQERVRTILASISDAVYVLDPEWRFSYLNERARELLELPGGHDPIGQPALEAFPAALGSTIQHEMLRAVAEGRPTAFETYYPEPLNRWFSVRAYPSAEGVTVYFQDISDQRRDQWRQAQAEHVDGLTRLAGTIAHDFNNLVTAIDGRVALLSDLLASHADASPDLHALRVACDDARKLATRLRRVSRGQVLATQAIDLRRLVHDLVATAPDVVEEHATEPLLVDVDRGELRRAIGGLVAVLRETTKWRHAITVSTRAVQPPGSGLAAVVLRAPGGPTDGLEESLDPVRLLFGDSGHGLGLDEIRGVVLQAGGTLAIEVDEQGTRLATVELPVTLHGVPAAGEPPAARRSSPTGDTVVVVDDNEHVLELLTRVLEHAGLQVEAHNDPIAAHDAIVAAPERVAAIVSDVRMPGCSGPELFDRLGRALVTVPPTVLISGFNDDPLLDDARRAGVRVLAKPFPPAAILEALAEVGVARPGAGELVS